MPLNENIVAGAEGGVIHLGVEWCITNLTIDITNNRQDVTSTCNYDATDKVVYKQFKTTSRDVTFSFEMDWDATNDPMPTFANVEGEEIALRIHDRTPGKFLFGPASIESVNVTSNGMDGVFHATINGRFEGKPTWADTYEYTPPEPTP